MIFQIFLCWRSLKSRNGSERSSTNCSTTSQNLIEWRPIFETKKLEFLNKKLETLIWRRKTVWRNNLSEKAIFWRKNFNFEIKLFIKKWFCRKKFAIEEEARFCQKQNFHLSCKRKPFMKIFENLFFCWTLFMSSHWWRKEWVATNQYLLWVKCVGTDLKKFVEWKIWMKNKYLYWSLIFEANIKLQLSSQRMSVDVILLKFRKYWTLKLDAGLVFVWEFETTKRSEAFQPL